MPTSYPDGLDNFTNPTASDQLDSVTVPHASQHTNINDAVEAIEGELGTNPKGTKATVKARLDDVDIAISSKVSTSVSISTTAPLAGGGDLSANRTLSVSTGSTSAAGVLQLTDSVSSTSTTTAATPNSVKTTFDLRSPIIKRQSATYFNSPVIITLAALTITHQRTYYAPIYIDQTTTVDRIAIRTANTFAGTATVRLGIYNNDATTGQPSTVLLDAGTVSATVASTNYEITINQTLTTGFYWVAMAQQGTAPTTSTYFGNSIGSTVNLLMASFNSPGGNANVGYIQNSVTGAFATAANLSLSASTTIVYLRVA